MLMEGLPAIHARLRRVAMESGDALDLIPREDGPGTLFYCDPPYLPSTRQARDVYAHEMSENEHRRLLDSPSLPGKNHALRLPLAALRPDAQHLDPAHLPLAEPCVRGLPQG